jgi:hypothetical protein
MYIWASVVYPAGIRTALELAKIPEQRHAPYLFAIGVIFVDDQLQIISDELDPGFLVPKELEVTVRRQRARCAEPLIRCGQIEGLYALRSGDDAEGRRASPLLFGIEP